MGSAVDRWPEELLCVAVLGGPKPGEPLPDLEISPQAGVTTVLAARGYPDRPEKGAIVTIPEDLPTDALVFHAGTRRDDAGRLTVSGGRVLTVTGMGPTLEAAQAVSRDVASRISFDGKQFRRDIGWREAKRQ